MPATSRGANLPSSSAELLQLADRVVEQQPRDVASLDRARVALRRALRAGHPALETEWRLSRVCFLMAQRLGHPDQVVERASAGVEHARAALRAHAGRVEPHYYLALNMAKIADAKSKLSLVKPMVAAAHRAADIDASYDGAGPLVFLGKVYLTAPAWPLSVGNLDKAIELLGRAVAIAPRPTTRVFLGQALFEDERYDEARQQLQRALREAKPDELEPKWRREAEKILREIEGHSQPPP